MRNLFKSAILSAALLGVAGAATADIKNEYLLDDKATIAENVMKVANFSTLIAAVQAAGLGDELMGAGPYTLFAPTDEAFAALPAGTVEDLLKPENMDRLVSLLKAHIVPGIYTSDDFSKAFLSEKPISAANVDMQVMDGMIDLNTDILTHILVEQKGDGLYVTAKRGTNDIAHIIEADIMNSNGVIHVIDHVITPDM